MPYGSNIVLSSVSQRAARKIGSPRVKLSTTKTVAGLGRAGPWPREHFTDLSTGRREHVESQDWNWSES